MVPLLERKFILLFKYIYCAGVKIFILPGAMLKVVDILNKHFFALYIYIVFMQGSCHPGKANLG